MASNRSQNKEKFKSDIYSQKIKPTFRCVYKIKSGLLT